MTNAYRTALQWFADNGPVGWFVLNAAPSRQMRNRLFKDGMIERVSGSPTRVVMYRLSPTGAIALAEKEGNESNG